MTLQRRRFLRQAAAAAAVPVLSSAAARMSAFGLPIAAWIGIAVFAAVAAVAVVSGMK